MKRIIILSIFLLSAIASFAQSANVPKTLYASGTDTYTITETSPGGAYSVLEKFVIQFTNANTGAATLNRAGLGPKPIKKFGNVALVSGDIKAGQQYTLSYDGTNFQLLGSPSDVSQSLTNGVTTKSPSEDVVFDALALKAPLASPALTGTPTVPTATAGTNTTQAASTAYVDGQTIKVYNIKSYGAVGDGRQTFDATTTASSTTVTCTTCAFTSGDVGKIILLAGAGTTSAVHKTTIATFVNSTTITITVAAVTSISNTSIIYGTDDGPEIQTVINLVYAAGGGSIYFPNGMYLVDNALQTSISGTNPNSQLYIPSVTDSSPLQPQINFIGESYKSLFGATVVAQTGVIIQSTLTTVSGTLPALIGGAGTIGNQDVTNFNLNYTYVTTKNINFRTYTNNGRTHRLGAFNGLQLQVTATNTGFGNDMVIVGSTTPTGSGTFGLIAGHVNDTGLRVLTNVISVGFDYGYMIGEHTKLNNCTAFACNVGLEVLNGNHIIDGTLSTEWCRTQLEFQNGTLLGIPVYYSGLVDLGIIDITLDLEDNANLSPAWYASLFVFKDPGNFARGKLTLLGSGNFPASSQFYKNYTGGRHLIQTIIDTKIVRSPNTSDAVGPMYFYPVGNTLNTLTTFNHIPIRQIVANQTGTTASMGADVITNAAIGLTNATENDLVETFYRTNGAINTGLVRRLMNKAGTMSVTDEESVDQRVIVPKLYLGATSVTPTAKLHLAAGTATANTAPIKLTSGTNTTTAETGAMEYNGTDLLFTPVGTNRLTVFTGYMGQTTLVTGTKAVTVNGVGTGSFCVVTLVSGSGTTLTTAYQCVCTANTITIQANVAAATINTADGSVVNYMVKP